MYRNTMLMSNHESSHLPTALRRAARWRRKDLGQAGCERPVGTQCGQVSGRRFILGRPSPAARATGRTDSRGRRAASEFSTRGSDVRRGSDVAGSHPFSHKACRWRRWPVKTTLPGEVDAAKHARGLGPAPGDGRESMGGLHEEPRFSFSGPPATQVATAWSGAHLA
jgi:hypothetical protein